MGNQPALLGALQNLVHNAFQLAANIQVKIECQCLDDQLLLLIRDNGPGISSQQRERIFEPFYTTKSQGTGLGLAVVQSVIKAHKGKLTVTNQPNSGACFAIQLPLIEAFVQTKPQDREVNI